jgi:hypothetical protein
VRLSTGSAECRDPLKCLRACTWIDSEADGEASFRMSWMTRRAGEACDVIYVLSLRISGARRVYGCIDFPWLEIGVWSLLRHRRGLPPVGKAAQPSTPVRMALLNYCSAREGEGIQAACLSCVGIVRIDNSSLLRSRKRSVL